MARMILSILCIAAMLPTAAAAAVRVAAEPNESMSLNFAEIEAPIKGSKKSQ